MSISTWEIGGLTHRRIHRAIAELTQHALLLRACELQAAVKCPLQPLQLPTCTFGVQRLTLYRISLATWGAGHHSAGLSICELRPSVRQPSSTI